MKYFITTLFTLTALAAQASDVEIVGVSATKSTSGWRFDVTLRHEDSGWDHYADGWRIELLDGTVLGTRVLAHPHVNEQPFTRSLSAVIIPEGETTVLIYAKDNLSEWQTRPFSIEIPVE